MERLYIMDIKMTLKSTHAPLCLAHNRLPLGSGINGNGRAVALVAASTIETAVFGSLNGSHSLGTSIEWKQL